jgi:hypothetical protein
MPRPLSETEILTLRAFQRQVKRLHGSRLAQHKDINLKFSQTVDNASGEVETSYEGYDPDEFQAQLPILRQFLLQNDSVSFYRIHNLIAKCCDRHELVGWATYTRRMWKETLGRVPFTDILFTGTGPQSVEDAVDKLFYGYGGLFHADIDKPDEEEHVRSMQEATLQSAFPTLCNCLLNLDAVIRLWLDEPDKPVPALPIDNASS